jgi:uncharacterized membrane protein YeaQ/YmgE (transglycosylase-associated protein family)
MDILILIAAMVVVGIIIGALAGPIWKDNRPFGVTGDYAAAIITAVVTGLLDFFVIPAMNFSDTVKWLGVALEPPLAALLVLWIVRKVKK